LEGRVTARQDVPARFAAAYDGYAASLAGGPLDASTRRAYASRIRLFLAWLDSGGTAGPDPLADHRQRDRVVRGYRDYLRNSRKLAVLTVNAHLTAVAHFYSYLNMGPAWVPRDESAYVPPEPLDAGEQERWLAAAGRLPLARDRAIARLLFHAGLRVSELVALDVDDVSLSARGGQVSVRSGGASREIPLTDRAARADIAEWTAARQRGPGGAWSRALFLNQRGGRLSARSVSQMLAQLADDAALTGPDGKPDAPPRRIRLTFAANLRRGLTGGDRQESLPRCACAASTFPARIRSIGAARLPRWGTFSLDA
jgi:site-specific recombinase XerC